MFARKMSLKNEAVDFKLSLIVLFCLFDMTEKEFRNFFSKYKNKLSKVINRSKRKVIDARKCKRENNNVFYCNDIVKIKIVNLSYLKEANL